MRILRSNVFALILPALALASPQETQQTNPLGPTPRFSGSVSFKGKDGSPKEVPVQIRNWSVLGGRAIDRFPEQGFLIVHLLAGQVSTVIDGKEQSWKTGDSWTVPAGSYMSLTVKREMATLQVVSIGK
jgi:uncharacterized cupin superfamily protein